MKLLRNHDRVGIGVFARIRDIGELPSAGYGTVEEPLSRKDQLIFYVLDNVAVRRNVPMRNATGSRTGEVHEMVDGIDAADPFPGSIPLLEDGHLNVSLQVGGAGRLPARVSRGWSIVLPAIGNGIGGVVVKAIVESRDVIRHAIIGSERTCRRCRAEARA